MSDFDTNAGGAARATTPNAEETADVLIVGYGPVGQVLAIQLAQRGWQVTVVERWPEPYRLPRAVAFDGEAARILAAVGISDSFDRIGESSRDYTVTNLAGDILFRLDVDDLRRNGWPDSTSMYQPGLEAALAERAGDFPNLRVLRGQEAVRLEERGDTVELTTVEHGTGNRRLLRARWVVGCDGANSFVRGTFEPDFTDFGFQHEWLVCDVVLHEPREFEHNNLQLADPIRPRVAVSAGPGHRRWEFMRMPGESSEEFNTEETAWRMLELCDVRPENATLDRFTSYVFQARLAHRWRSGRVLLAGDAVHLMPPFAGQGMCSGLRDAANLAWKLDLVLRDGADQRLLDSYDAERRPHVKNAITMSVNLGRAICMTDPKAAADRDTVMMASRQRGLGLARPQTVLETLVDGFLHRDGAGKPVAPAGKLGPQARVAEGEVTDRFDSVVGTGFVLLTTEEPDGLLDAGQRELLDSLGGRVVRLLPAGTTPPRRGGVGEGGEGGDRVVVDVDGVYLSFLAELSASAVLVRPDFYVFGAVRERSQLPALLSSLREQLSPAVVAA
ncbi:bifunctional 3-(3-hydroxy-phenyl)propionate/3-hydroxycinnamic acid hydroxylase [Kitasatospora sp. NPDC036755]|uniref:bifunctional 3-(3-hydroxy-phenyl)propionate/3-hydroxycinnamic acid hydroxylase MhpA n=1 Tax=Kitasatospora sp. NPDC036755 TaxID=3154600 RepID=UPI0033F49E27